MKKKFLAFGLAATMILGSAFSTFAATEDKTVDKTVYSNTEDFALDGEVSASDAIANPLKGLDTDKVSIEYTLTTSNALAAWLGLAQFYNEGEGFVNIMFWPQITYNGMGGTPNGYFELGTGADKIFADEYADGNPHTYKYVLTNDSCEIYVDGEAVATTIKGTSENLTTIAEVCNACFEFITTAEKFTLGIGMANFWGELDNTSTINSFKITATVAAEEDPSEEDPSEEEPTSKNSPQGGDEDVSKPSAGEENPNPDEQETTGSSPVGGNEEVVNATIVSAEAAKAIAEAAVVTSKDGKVLDVELVVTPVEDTTAVAGLIAEDAALAAAKVKAFAVLDLELKVGGKNVTYLDEKINVTVPMDKIFANINADDMVAVYRVDKDMVFSFLGTAKVAADKTITFETDHFTQYVFALVDNAEALSDVQIADSKVIYAGDTPDVKVADIPVKANASVENPDQNKTGDTTPIIPLVVLAVVALGGVVAAVASKKRA